MNSMRTLRDRILHGRAAPRQDGVLTVFTAMLILLLMVAMVAYATRVGLLETRSSGNEMRQKVAFHAAEAGLDQAVMYLLANSKPALSAREDAFSDGTALTRDGWFSASDTRWVACPSTPAADHPCGGDVGAATGSFYYDTDGDTDTYETLPVDTTGLSADSTVRVTALMCFLNPGSTTCDGPSPPSELEETSASLMLTLLAYGYSDCNGTGLDTATNLDAICTGKATIAQPLSNFKTLKGAPSVPLVTKGTWPPTGSAEVVAAPNGGGWGVPMSVWDNGNSSCLPPDHQTIVSFGSWQTCELQEWYSTMDLPSDVACSDTVYGCQCGDNSIEENTFQGDAYLSYRRTVSDLNIGLDIIIDPNFPCDLFEFYFGVSDTDYEIIKYAANEILEDCSSLGPDSSGLIWISGDECLINGTGSIGSVENPVVLVSAASHTILEGEREFFGVVYVFDGEDPAADISASGTQSVYGAVIVDAGIDIFQGTFQVVFAEGVLASAGGLGGLGAVNGGWRDFGLPDMAW